MYKPLADTTKGISRIQIHHWAPELDRGLRFTTRPGVKCDYIGRFPQSKKTTPRTASRSTSWSQDISLAHQISPKHHFQAAEIGAALYAVFQGENKAVQL